MTLTPATQYASTSHEMWTQDKQRVRKDFRTVVK